MDNRGRLLLLVIVALAACRPGVPPQPATPRTGTDVSAGFAQTWEAAVDLFADSNLTVTQIERASGFIVAGTVRLYSDTAHWRRGHPFADCGMAGQTGLHYQPAAGAYTVVVRGDSVRSRVKASVRFVSADVGAFDCSSKGVWEAAFERVIAGRAVAKLR